MLLEPTIGYEASMLAKEWTHVSSNSPSARHYILFWLRQYQNVAWLAKMFEESPDPLKEARVIQP